MENIHNTAVIHPTAIVDSSAIIKECVEVGPFAIIEPSTFIEQNAYIGPHCVIGKNNRIGSSVVIQGNVRTGKDCEIMQGAVVKWGCILTDRVTIENGVFLGAGVVTLGSDKDMKEKHGTYIATGAWIGGGTYIGPGLSICAGAKVGALSFVKEDIKQPGTYVGTPAELVKRKWRCKKCEVKGEIATKNSMTVTQEIIQEAHCSASKNCAFYPDNIIFD